MLRKHVWPEGHWDWPIHVSHKHGLRAGNMIFVGGQVDLDSSGTVQHPGDLDRQTEAVMENIRRVLAGFGADPADLVKLVAYYATDGHADETKLLAAIAAALPGDGAGPVVSAVPLPALAYDGMVVEIEAIAMRGADDRQLPRRAADPAGLVPLPRPFSHGLQCGEMIFVGGQDPLDADGKLLDGGDIVAQMRGVMDRIGLVLGRLGADFDDVVKIKNWYQGEGRFEDWEAAARARAAYFREPGPAATGIPLPRHWRKGHMIRSDVIAMRDENGARLSKSHSWPEGHWDWPIHLPYKHGVRCGNLVFLGGQVALTPQGVVMEPHDLVAQTKRSMEMIRRVLEAHGLGFDDVVKVTAYYQGGASADQLHANLKIRSGCFTEPGPTSTGIPLPALAYVGMMIEIEIIAMTR
ncbi:MAG: RidA family protein [Rhodospirillaceae bacterium]|nr:RidA family protein [Rhodospirillaceae bacterium]